MDNEKYYNAGWVATIGFGAVVGGLFGGPAGMAYGITMGVFGYAPTIAAVKIGQYLKQTYQDYKASHATHTHQVTFKEEAEIIPDSNYKQMIETMGQSVNASNASAYNEDKDEYDFEERNDDTEQETINPKLEAENAEQALADSVSIDTSLAPLL